jgi:hypothetical protein
LKLTEQKAEGTLVFRFRNRLEIEGMYGLEFVVKKKAQGI